MEIKDFKLDKSIFAEALRRELSEESIEILEVRNNCMSAKGFNFLSDLFKISVRFTTVTRNEKKTERSVDMVIKTEPLNEISLNFVRQQDLFSTELKFFRHVLPKIHKFVGYQIGPQLWYASDNPRVLIMEDLTKRGFIMKDRQKGLSLDHCLLVIEQMAKLHAGSVAVFEKDPEIIKSFRDGIVSPKCPLPFLRLMEVSLLRISEAVEKWSHEKCALIARKLRKLAETICTQCVDVYNYDPDEFCVLNHGDCWINNMMFRETDEGQPSDLVLVDYQMSVYTSPAVDLLYFLNICPEIDVKYDKDELFLDMYLNTLKNTMKNIGCKTKPPTMEQLKAAIHKRRIYAVFSGIVLYLRMIANKEDTEDFEQLTKLSGETRMDVFKNPDAVKVALKMLPVMDERGYLD